MTKYRLIKDNKDAIIEISGEKINQLPAAATINDQNIFVVADKTTGNALQATRAQMIASIGVSSFQSCTPTTNPTGAVNGSVYFPTVAGTYTNFKDSGNNSIVVSGTEGVVYFIYNGTYWTKYASTVNMAGYYTSAQTDALLAPINTELWTNINQTKTYGHTGVMASAVTDNPWCELIAVTAAGTLTNFILNEWAVSISNATIYTLNVSGANTVIKTKTTGVTLSAQNTDISALNIQVAVGDYVGIYFTGIVTYLKNNTAGGSGLGQWSTSTAVGATITVNPALSTRALDYQFIVTTPVKQSNKPNTSDVLLNTNVVGVVGTNTNQVVNQNKYTADLYNLVTTSDPYGHTTVGTNNWVSNNGWGEAYQVANAGYIQTIYLTSFAGSSINANIYVINSSTLAIKSITAVVLPTQTTDLTGYNIQVAATDYIGFYSSAIATNVRSTTSGGGGLINFPSTAIVGTVVTLPGAQAGWQLDIKITVYSSRYVSKLTSPATRTLSYANADSLIILGSSLTESTYSMNGVGWIEKINDFSDLPIVNAGIGGVDWVYNMNQVVNDVALRHDTSNTIRGCHPAYIMFENSANGSPVGVNAIPLLRAAKDVCRFVGAKMLLGTEEYWIDYGYEHDRKVSSFSYTDKIPYSALSKLYKMLVPAQTYSGFFRSGHSGYRVQSFFAAHWDNLISRLPIAKTIKYYRVRPTYKVGSPAVTDLTYVDSYERIKKFYAVSAGNGNADNTTNAGIDNLDDHTKDVSGGLNTATPNNETSYLLRGADLSFTNFALIEFIIEDVGVNTFTITASCSVSPSLVFLRCLNKANFTSSTFTTPATLWQTAIFTYSGTTLTVAINNDASFCLYDKVSLLIQVSGTFNLSKAQIVYNATVKKIENESTFFERKFGPELLNFTDFVQGAWTLTGAAAVKSYPAGIDQYTAFNTQKSHLELVADGDTASKTVTITQPCTKIALRIVAQQFYKIATTRFNSNPTVLNSGYIANNAPQITAGDFDYGELLVTINTNAVYRALVWQGWHEIYFEIPIYNDATSFTITLGRTSLVDSSYNNQNQGIHIHNVSAQRIA
jgi:hypothetical protein